MNPYFRHIPLGEPLPLNNAHAVSVSLPTLADVIGYEENDLTVKSCMKSGYPRFFMNKFVVELCEFVRKKHSLPENFEIIPLMDKKSLQILQNRFQIDFKIIEENDIYFLAIDNQNKQLAVIKDFIRHTGLTLSSRKAETVLKSNLENSEVQIDTKSLKENEIKNTLAQAYGTTNQDNVFLCSCGMNAVYSIYETIQKLNKNTEKQLIIQAGWLYLDTFEIIKKFSTNSILISNITDNDVLLKTIENNAGKIGAVFTELPNNPLIQCIDLPELHKKSRQFNIPLIVDLSIGTPYNITALQYCDAAVESLTKFANGKGDVMMGAIILNENSNFYSFFKNNLSDFLTAPFFKDIDVLAENITGYQNRVQKISENTALLIDYLKKSPAIAEIHSVLHPQSLENFLKIRKSESALPGLISVVFNKDLQFFYDKINLPKGPSLGTEFTLLMPYVYLAHYDLVKTSEGRKELQKMGLHHDLLRISVGKEPINEIINAFKEAGI